MSSELAPLPVTDEPSNIDLFERFKDVAVDLRTKLSRLAAIGLLAAGTLTVQEIVAPEVAHADTTTYGDLGYPWKDAVCEFGSGGGSSCTNPNNPSDSYDWGVYISGTFHPYRSGYEYRNCTDYVQWKESTLGVTVPSNWGNGGQWYTMHLPVKDRPRPKPVMRQLNQLRLGMLHS